MIAKKICIAAALTAGFTTAAQAGEHQVVLTGFSYFPAVTYAAPGDTIIFINDSGEEQTVVGADIGWTVGPLAAQAEGSLVVTEETELKFFAAYVDDWEDGVDDGAGSGDSDDNIGADYGTYEDAPIRAEISFEAPPLSSS